jgi:hypothetical protein
MSFTAPSRHRYWSRAFAWRCSTILSSITDKNILFGIFALQTGFITRQALISALTTWVRNKNSR